MSINLEDLPLTADEREKIASLGVPNAAALLAMIEAAPRDFAAFFGSERARELTTALERAVSPSEKSFGESSLRRFPVSGAILDRKPPVLREPHYDVETRDRLFEQLQSLRRRGDSSADTRRQIAELEQSLNALLEAK